MHSPGLTKRGAAATSATMLIQHCLYIDIILKKPQISHKF